MKKKNARAVPSVSGREKQKKKGSADAARLRKLHAAQREADEKSNDFEGWSKTELEKALKFDEEEWTTERIAHGRVQTIVPNAISQIISGISSEKILKEIEDSLDYYHRELRRRRRRIKKLNKLIDGLDDG